MLKVLAYQLMLQSCSTRVNWFYFPPSKFFHQLYKFGSFIDWFYPGDEGAMRKGGDYRLFGGEKLKR